MSDTNDTAEIIKDLTSKPEIPIKGNTKDFLAKFSKQHIDAHPDPVGKIVCAIKCLFFIIRPTGIQYFIPVVGPAIHIEIELTQAGNKHISRFHFFGYGKCFPHQR